MATIYDAENQILGRLGSVIAKQLIGGESVFVVNVEKSVISGSRRNTSQASMPNTSVFARTKQPSTASCTSLMGLSDAPDHCVAPASVTLFAAG